MLRRAVAICSVLILAHSLWFTWRYFESTPWLDMWDWVTEFEKWPQGTYGWRDLIAEHNDHRIATARLFFLTDTVLFHMSGRFVVVSNLILLGLLAVVLHRLWRSGVVRGSAADLPILFFAAFITSVCQWENLVTPFQIQFALLCLFATLSATCLAWATAPSLGPSKPALLSLAAAGAYTLAVFSMAGGVLLLVPLAVLLALRRRGTLVPLVFLLPAGATLLVFFAGYTWHSLVTPLAAFRVSHLMLGLNMIGLALGFVGSALGAFGEVAAEAAGIVGFAALGLFGWFIARARFRPAAWPIAAAAFLALAVWVVVNACAAGRMRILFGASGGLASRYALLSMLFWLSLAGAGLHVLLASGARRASAAISRSPLVPVSAMAALLAINISPTYEQHAAGLRHILDIAGTTMRAGVYAPGLIGVLNPFGLDRVIDAVRFAHQKHLTVFATSGRPPSAVRGFLDRVDVDRLPVCLGALDMVYRLDATRTLLRAWLATPGGERTADWIEVIDSAHRVDATLPAEEARGDVPLPARRTEALGVLAGIAGGMADGPLTLVGVFGDHRACRLTVRGPGPVQILPLLEPAGLARPSLLADAEPPRLSPAFSAAAGSLAGLPRPWNGAPVWSSAVGNPAIGEASLRVRLPAGSAGLLVPFATGSDPAGQSLVFAFADGVRIEMPIPADTQPGQWRVAAVPPELLARHSGFVTIIARDAGTTPDQWIAVAPPFVQQLDPDAASLFP